MFGYARYELTTPLSAEEVHERIARHTIHWRFGSFPKSYEDVPPEQLHFIGRVSADSFRLQINDDNSENSSHAVARGRISAGPDGTRITVRSAPPLATWFMAVTFTLLGLPCLAAAAVYPFYAGVGWEWLAMLITGLTFAGVILWAVLKGRSETKLFRRRLKALLRPTERTAPAKGAD